MLPGPTIMRSCTKCNQLIEQETIVSGNTCSSRFWTDGWRVSPMLPDYPQLVKCPNCKMLFWIDEAPAVGEKEPFGEADDKWVNAKSIKVPSRTDYYKFLACIDDNPEKEQYIRMRAWWATNSKYRKNSIAAFELKPADIRNLEALSALIKDTSEEAIIMKAEIERELGHFGDCLSLLNRKFDDELTFVVEFIKALAGKHERRVMEIKQ